MFSNQACCRHWQLCTSSPLIFLPFLETLSCSSCPLLPSYSGLEMFQSWIWRYNCNPFSLGSFPSMLFFPNHFSNTHGQRAVICGHLICFKSALCIPAVFIAFLSVTVSTREICKFFTKTKSLLLRWFYSQFHCLLNLVYNTESLHWWIIICISRTTYTKNC